MPRARIPLEYETSRPLRAALARACQSERMTFRFVSALLLTCSFAVVAGCDDPASMDPGPDGECDVPEAATWVSVAPRECGLGPGGDAGPETTYCHWMLALDDDGTGTWQHSDVSQNLTHECDGSTLTITVASQAPAEATYDAIAGELTFDGVADCVAGSDGCAD